MKIQDYLAPLNLFLSHKDYFGLSLKPMPNLIMAVTLGSIPKLTETKSLSYGTLFYHYTVIDLKFYVKCVEYSPKIRWGYIITR